jgi:mannose-6-phosphate isomerase-like protein (cupin superfamily)
MNPQKQPRIDAMIIQPYATVTAYRTKDGSEIRELMHPDVHGNRAQSLAEATVPAGRRTLLHRHQLSEELYHITAGLGRMTLGADCFDVGPGDTIYIAPGTAHCIEAIGTKALRLLCCCAPAYSHGDTELLEQDTAATPGTG